MATALQVVNKVLRRLREDTVTDFSADYSQLILDFVNEAKIEVENAWNWSMLRTTIDVTTVAGTRQYSLTGAGSRFRILRGEDTLPMVYDTTNKSQLYMATGRYFADAALTTSSGTPSTFRITGQDANGDPYVEFESIPDGVYVIRFHLFVPQADLSAITDVLKVPDHPVVMGAWTKAISERGEDGGQNTIEQQMMYVHAMADAIAMDESRVLFETDWQAV